MMNLKVVASLAIVFICMAASCSSDKKVKRDMTKKLQPIVLTDTASTYYYNITSETVTNLEVADKQVFNNKQSAIGLIYGIKKDSVGNLLLTVTFDKLHYSIKTQEKEDEMDATTGANSFNSTERMLSTLKGTSLYIRLNKNGNVLSVDGYDAITQKLLTVATDRSPDTKAMLQKQLAEVIGDEFIKNNILESVKTLPDSTIYVGDSWERKSSQSAAGMHYSSNTVYTFMSLENGIATIESESTITNDKDKGSDLSSLLSMNNVQAEINGKQSGKFTINTSTGMLLSNTSSSAMKGTIKVAGRDIPISIKTKKEITAKKI